MTEFAFVEDYRANPIDYRDDETTIARGSSDEPLLHDRDGWSTAAPHRYYRNAEAPCAPAAPVRAIDYADEALRECPGGER